MENYKFLLGYNDNIYPGKELGNNSLFMDIDGTTSRRVGYRTTGKIYVPKTLNIIRRDVDADLCNVVAFDVDGQPITGERLTGKLKTWKLPDETSYIRVCVHRGQVMNLYAYREIVPIYKDDMTLDYDKESGQQFYRKSLSGKITVVNDVFDFLYTSEFQSEFRLLIMRTENGQTWREFYVGSFTPTDCTFNVDDRICEFSAETIDDYKNVLAGMEKEYNLFKLHPEIQRLVVRKRPLIQTYVPGDKTVSCFLENLHWEQEANKELNEEILKNEYKFALTNILKEINITTTPGLFEGKPAEILGLYAGRMSVVNETKYDGKLYPIEENGYYMYVMQDKKNGWKMDDVLVEIRRTSDDVALFRYTKENANDPFDIAEFNLTPVEGAGGSGIMRADMKSYNVYARMLCNSAYIYNSTTDNLLITYPIPYEDIVDNNRNYLNVIPYREDIAYISNNYTPEPNEYGLADNNQYFAPPKDVFGVVFYPIAQSTWKYASLWYTPSLKVSTYFFERDGATTHILRDTYPLASCIQVLLKEFAPGVTHEATPEYSQFLYNETNPLTGGTNPLLSITPKSNVTFGEYQQPAQKAIIKFQDLTNMLKNMLKCYWYIEDNKFKIEHIEWFRRGGTYGGDPIVGLDATNLKNIRNGKPWSFATNEFSFDKINMSERFQFSWMDETTQLFDGLPIEIKSRYVTKGKVEDVTISNFTSDIDYMLLNPGEISPDGFAIFASMKGNPIKGYLPIELSGTNGFIKPYIPLFNAYGGQRVILELTATGKGQGSIGFFANDIQLGGDQATFIADGDKQLTVYIPAGATDMAIKAAGPVNVTNVTMVAPDLRDLPMIKQTIDGVKYRLQNGLLAFSYLQPTVWSYDMPAKELRINNVDVLAKTISKEKKQILTLPVDPYIKPLRLIKTGLGNGKIEKISLNLHSLSAKITLKYDTEQ